MKTKAVVTAKIEIRVNDTWSSSTTLEQAQKQSKASAEQCLRKVLDKAVTDFKIIDFKSTIVILEE